MPGRDQSWWEDLLDPSMQDGLSVLHWHTSDDSASLFWSVSATDANRGVSIRLPRPLERDGSDHITESLMVNIETRPTPAGLGSWVIESPPKWFRRRRAWALNRPPFVTGDPWFDEQAGCWAWDCGEGVGALRRTLAPLLPVVRDIIEHHPGVTVTDASVNAWLPWAEAPERLSSLLVATRSLSQG